MTGGTKGYIPEELWQDFKEFLSEDISVDPESPKHYWLTNKVNRALSFLMGWNYSTGRPVKLACMSDGSLRTTSLGTGFTTQLPTVLNLAASASQTISFSKTTARLDIWAVGGDLLIQRKISGGALQTGFVVYNGGYLSVDAQQDEVVITNQSTTAANTGQIVAWY